MQDTEISVPTYLYAAPTSEWKSYDGTVWLQQHSKDDMALHIIGRVKPVFALSDKEKPGPLYNCVARLSRDKALELYETLGRALRATRRK